jgi:hypothetical protein
VDPVVTPKDPQAVPQDPAVEKPEPAKQLSDAQVAELEGLIGDQRFKEALTRIADLVGDDHQRQGWIAEVTRRHGDARAAMQRAAMKAGSEDEARTLLEPAIRLWSMEGDRAWADALIQASSSRGAGQMDPVNPTPVVVPEGPNPATPASLSTESPNGFLLTALRADAKIDDVLAQGNLPEAERILKTIEEASTEAGAIRHKIQLWGRRSKILADIIAARSPRIRAQPPIANAPWDVVGAAPEHLLLAEPSGAKMNLAWSQVKRAELGQIFGDAAVDKNATPMDVALAAVGNLIAQQPGPATLAASRATKLQYEGARELQLLLDMFRERQLVILLDEADAAVQSNDPVRLAKVIEELGRGDRLQNPVLATRVAELQKTLAGLQAGGTSPQTAGGSQIAPGSGKDHLTFDDAADRLAFGERTGAWSVAQGVITNNGDGSLSRNDCGNASGLLLAFTPTRNQGGFTVDFRGVRLVMDLTAQQYLVTSQDERIQPKAFPFLANTQYVVYYTLASDGKMSIQINQADPLTIKTGRLSSRLGLVTDTGAAVSIDEVEVRRGGAATEAAVTSAGIDPAQQQILREALGIEPLGGAYKDPDSPAIILPRIASGQSGIAIPILAGMKGVVFTVTGQDAVSVGVGTVATDSGTATGPFYEAPLPIDGEPPLQISVTLTAQHFLVQIEQEGAQASTYEVELPADRTHIYLRAALEAQVLKTPKILR